MEYALTMDDINALEGAGFNMMGVGEGTPATPQEIKVLGIQLPPAPAVDTAAPDLDGLLADVRLLQSGPAGGPQTAPASAFPPAGTPLDAQGNPLAAPMQTAPMQTAPMQSANPLASFLQPAPETQSNDPFANLSRTQRQMLAFSALSDAGAALAGRDGNMFNKTLGSFNDMADMQRKRDAANAQNEMMRRLLGGAAGGAGVGAGGSVEEQRAAAMQLLMIPEMVPYAQALLARLDAEAATMASAETSLISINAGIAATEALLNSPNLDVITGFRGGINSAARSMINKAEPDYVNLMSYVEKLNGINFLEAYLSLKGGGSITEMETAQATAARSRVNAALAGNVSDLRGALEEVNALFQQGRERNPAYIAQMQAAAAAAPVATSALPPAQTTGAPATGAPAAGAATTAPVLPDPLGIR